MGFPKVQAPQCVWQRPGPDVAFGMQGNVFQLKHLLGVQAPLGIWGPLLVSLESKRRTGCLG